jgi:hypothetical protein
MEDVRYNISSSIEDIMSLINYCSTDQNARILCSNRYFWEQQFNRFKLPLDNNIQYNNPYDWIQLLLKTKYVIGKLNQLNERPIKSVLFTHDIPLNDIYNIIKKESNINDNIETYLQDTDNVDFIQALMDNYPLMINEILLTKNHKRLFLVLIINKNIENIPGGVDILQETDEIVFQFTVKYNELENIMIKLIPYF